MKGFFKIVLASFVALILFTVIGIFILIGLISSKEPVKKFSTPFLVVVMIEEYL